MAALWPINAVRAVTASDQGSLMLLGSSSMNGSLGHLLADDFTELGYRVARHGYPAAGLARPDFRDIRQIVDQLPITGKPAAALLYFGSNDAQSIWLRPDERIRHKQTGEWIAWSDERWPAIYEARTNKLLRSLCTRGVQHAIVLSPGDVSRERLQTRLDRIRTIQQRAVQNTPCGHYVSMGGDGGKFEYRGTALRTPDGVHMTRAGAQRVWKRVRSKVLALIAKDRNPLAIGEPLSRR